MGVILSRCDTVIHTVALIMSVSEKLNLVFMKHKRRIKEKFLKLFTRVLMMGLVTCFHSYIEHPRFSFLFSSVFSKALCVQHVTEENRMNFNNI